MCQNLPYKRFISFILWTCGERCHVEKSDGIVSQVFSAEMSLSALLFFQHTAYHSCLEQLWKLCDIDYDWTGEDVKHSWLLGISSQIVWLIWNKISVTFDNSFTGWPVFLRRPKKKKKQRKISYSEQQQ